MARILITGTSKGIGYEATLLLARAGHEVIATMRNPSACDLERVAKEAKLPVTVLSLDVDDDASVADVFGRVGQSVDVLVNNAGIYSINAVEDESLEQFRRVMETNYLGAVRCVKHVLPFMRKRRSGCIVNITSIAGRIAFGATSAYNASKFALEGFTESLAQEVKGYGIRVALVEPGIIDTAMATTNLPQYDQNTIYPHGRRIHAFFTNPNKGEASPALVGEMIRYVIESDDPRLRFPVGPDALPFLGWRSSVSDEDWVGLGGLEELLPASVHRHGSRFALEPSPEHQAFLSTPRADEYEALNEENGDAYTSRDACGTMAEPASRGLDRHVRRGPHVDSDRWQDPTRPEPVVEPLLARHALRDGPWTIDVADPSRRSHVPDRFRLRRASADDPIE